MPKTTPVRTAYVCFPAAGGSDLMVAGKLTLPARDEAASPGPAVVICHGSDGVDGRGDFHARALTAAGLATLEIDMWAARGTGRGAAARPRSPIDTLPDAFGALRFLAAQPEVDACRIGVMGFSWGGVVTLLSATRGRSDPLRAAGPGFAAHAALYPVCWAYTAVSALGLAGRTGAPILIQTGDADTYDAPDGGERLADALRSGAEPGEIELIVHSGAGHGFDRDLPAQTITDPFAHQGKGGEVLMAFHPAAAARARVAVVDFFSRRLGPV